MGIADEATAAFTCVGGWCKHFVDPNSSTPVSAGAKPNANRRPIHSGRWSVESYIRNRRRGSFKSKYRSDADLRMSNARYSRTVSGLEQIRDSEILGIAVT